MIDFNKAEDKDKFKESISRIISPIKMVDDSLNLFPFFFTAKRSNAGKSLPPYYLVYFLFIDLMEFEDLGETDKTAWSIPIDYKGELYLIEYRKSGVGIFINEDREKEAEEICEKIKLAVKAASPFFEFTAEMAAQQSRLNVVNRHKELFDRFIYFLKGYKLVIRKIKTNNISISSKNDATSLHSHFPSVRNIKTANWLAIAAIEAFFSWTEHVFILIAILNGKIKTGNDVSLLAFQDWSHKFKSAFVDIKGELKVIYDELLEIRRQVRNYMAHGSFGKQGEAFRFHSGTGAVPMLLPHKKGVYYFSEGFGFDNSRAIKTIQRFLEIIWTDERALVKIYIDKFGLPLILTLAADGSYEKAMQSADNMESLCHYLQEMIDRSANMDF
jgi:hypothetical protein